MPLMLSGRVDSYEVWGKLSKGGMGEVYLARHADLALPVILKALHPTAGEAPEAGYRRLLDEARMMARLAAPQVVRVLDVIRGGAGQTPALVEEYVDGIDLDELRRRRQQGIGRRLPLWAVAEMTAHAAAGLHAAHQAGLVHRDVKPSNLFGYARGQLKVGDFGMAVSSGSGPATVGGTPGFMAPEQMGVEHTGRRSDIFSLGATAFMLRYGLTPFEGLPGPDSVPRFSPALSPEEAYFQHVLRRMLAWRPEDRYPNAAMVGRRAASLARATSPPPSVTARGPHDYDVRGVHIRFEVGDISRVETDAVVSSAHSKMHMRSGVGQALRVAGGDEIEEEATRGGERPLGECIATGAGKLTCRAVLHAVAAWNEVSCVGRATQRALLLADSLGFERIALPAIGTGRGGVKFEACADAMIAALNFHLDLGGSRLREVRFVLRDNSWLELFLDTAAAELMGRDEAEADHTDAALAEFDADSDTMYAPSSERE